MSSKICKREKCELCQKYIYSHDTILVCSIDNKAYHAKCFKISTDTAIEIQNSPDWICPLCLKDTIPFFDLENTSPVINSCHCCKKLLVLNVIKSLIV